MIPTKILWDAVSQPFKRAQTGLFQGRTKQFGNNVPFSYKKTRRSWSPNVQQKRLQSEVLDETIRVKLTTRALRTIKKKGGLDNYLKTTSAETLGHMGMKLRMRLLEAQRLAMGRKPLEYTLPSPSARRAIDAKRTSSINVLGINGPASLETARAARTQAAKALGQADELASVQDTIAYLQRQAAQREIRRTGLITSPSEPTPA